MSEFVIWSDVEVRFRDTDAMGHVNNAVFVTYLEVARQTYWKRLDATAGYERVPFILAHVSIDFRSPVRVGEVVRVHLRTTWVGRSSFGMQYELRERDSGRLVAEATTTQVTYDYTQHRPIPVPDGLRRSLEQIEGHPLPEKPRRP